MKYGRNFTVPLDYQGRGKLSHRRTRIAYNVDHPATVMNETATVMNETTFRYFCSCGWELKLDWSLEILYVSEQMGDEQWEFHRLKSEEEAQKRVREIVCKFTKEPLP